MSLLPAKGTKARCSFSRRCGYQEALIRGIHKQRFEMRNLGLITMFRAIRPRDLALHAHMHCDGPIFIARPFPTVFLRFLS